MPRHQPYPTAAIARSDKRSRLVLSVLFAFLFLLNTNPSFAFANPNGTFRFHLFSEPSSLKPWQQRNANAGYFLSQITGTLLNYQDGKLEGNLAESCRYLNAKKISCLMRPGITFSQGQEIKASHFKKAFQEMLKPDNKAFRADLLFPIKNAKAIFQGKTPADKIGISVQTKNKTEEIIFELESADREFIYTLASPLLFPIPDTDLSEIEKIREKPELWNSSGAFKITAWQPQKKITLKPRAEHWKKNLNLPDVEIIFVPEDSVAVGLYERKQLDFLRRLPTLYINKYKTKPDFHDIDQLRFDYIGLQIPDLNARKAIAASLNYQELQSLFSAKVPPGCPGIFKSMMKEYPCHSYSPATAAQFWSKAKVDSSKWELMYSKLGGDDHQRSMEWIQSEIKKNLKVNIKLRGLENKIFVEALVKEKPALFRKGVPIERPTCLAALENFISSSEENFLNFKSSAFDQVVTKLRQESSDDKKKELCSEAVSILMDQAWIIPTGPIYFSILVKPEWTGWRLNELNQLDLSELRKVKK